jgi:hypothetical protein
MRLKSKHIFALAPYAHLQLSLEDPPLKNFKNARNCGTDPQTQKFYLFLCLMSGKWYDFHKLNHRNIGRFRSSEALTAFLAQFIHAS